MQAVSQSKNRPSDPRNREVVHAAGDPQNGNLATPINDSGIVKAFINNLPAYRQGLAPFRRGLEIGMAHGYWLIGPFAKLGPLRDTDVANLAGLMASVGLIVILTAALSIYAGSRPPAPTDTVAVDRKPQMFDSAEGWNEFAGGFLIGGVGGAAFAYFVLANIGLIKGLMG